MQFGKGMKVMRALRDMSQAALSVETGVALTNIARAERGVYNLKREQADRVRMALCWPKEIDTMLDKLAGIRYEQ